MKRAVIIIAAVLVLGLVTGSTVFADPPGKWVCEISLIEDDTGGPASPDLKATVVAKHDISGAHGKVIIVCLRDAGGRLS